MLMVIKKMIETKADVITMIETKAEVITMIETMRGIHG